MNESIIKNYNEEGTITNSYSKDSNDTISDVVLNFENNEDISFPCKLCKEFVYYGELKLHRRLHEALSRLQINNSMSSLTAKMITKRRNAIFKQLKNICDYDQLKTIREKLDSDFSTLHNFIIKEKHQEFPIDNLLTSDENKRKSPLNDTDVTVICKNEMYNISFGCRKVKCPLLFVDHIDEMGILVGQVTQLRGECAQKFVSQQFSTIFRKVLSENSNTKSDFEKINEAFEVTCKKLDQELETGLHDKVTYKSFCSCTVEAVFISKTDHSIHIMNIGNGRIVLINKDGHYLLNELHSTSNNNEIERIRQNGGRLTVLNGKIYLNGQTEVTRALGGHGDGKVKMYQTSQPYIQKIKITDDIKGIVFMNSKLATTLTEEDAEAIFTTEILGNSRPFNTSSCIVDTDDIQDLIEESLSDSSISQLPIPNTNLPQTVSEAVAKKLVNAALLYEKYDGDYSAVIFHIL